MKSIINNKKECFICGAKSNLEVHHIFFGNPWRKISDREGFTIYLCPEHHRTGPEAPHQNREIDLDYKRLAQRCYEDTHSREEFIKLIGRNYL